MKTLRISTMLLLLTATPLLASEPPATLPKEFLAQLPLLMSLSEQEFEGLLASAELTSDKNDEEKKNED